MEFLIFILFYISVSYFTSIRWLINCAVSFCFVASILKLELVDLLEYFGVTLNLHAKMCLAILKQA